MHELKHPEKTKYVVAHNGNGLMHYAKVEPQNCFKTGQPFMEVFDSEEEAKERFPESFKELNLSPFD
jgi:hypothetical protein